MVVRPTAIEIVTALALQPHPEGGFFRETYRAATGLETPRGWRPACTAILFLVTPSAPSRLHRLNSDELWIAQAGVPLEITAIDPDGELRRHVLGNPGEALRDPGPMAIERGAPLPQALVPGGWWQGARVAGAEQGGDVDGACEGGAAGRAREWSLVSCVVTPGFCYEDYELGGRRALLTAFPQHARLIAALTAPE